MVEKMADKYNCNLCGSEFDEGNHVCPGCGVETELLKQKVQLPPARGAVNDYPGILTDEQVGELSNMVGSFFKQTDVPIVITIVQTAEPLKPSEYAFLLYNHWGIGKARVNRGLLILLCMKEKHLESEVGLGLEKILPEKEGDEIVQNEFIPHFKESGFFDGLKAGTKAIIDALSERLPTLE